MLISATLYSYLMLMKSVKNKCTAISMLLGIGISIGWWWLLRLLGWRVRVASVCECGTMSTSSISSSTYQLLVVRPEYNVGARTSRHLFPRGSKCEPLKQQRQQATGTMVRTTHRRVTFIIFVICLSNVEQLIRSILHPSNFEWPALHSFRSIFYFYS